MSIEWKLDFNFENIAILFDESFFTVECSEVNLLEFAECRIYRVSACASIVECPFRHLVNSSEELFFPFFCRSFWVSFDEPDPG